MAELVYLMEHNIRPEMQYLGRENAQNLVERIYTKDTIFDKQNIERIYGDSFLDITDLNQLPMKLTAVIKRFMRF